MKTLVSGCLVFLLGGLWSVLAGPGPGLGPMSELFWTAMALAATVSAAGLDALDD
ncbi:hypothetical protein [Bosea sp. LC85]|uniref:hypothetical protein n=1 Tax=Bosea sp. LC85 TaxID=1502851 RepID=UPI000A7E2161|nr:hypothetical protein [Bosea sp. LC85]